MFIDDSEFNKVMKGTLKRKDPARTINMQMTEEAIAKLDSMSKEHGIARNKYIALALEHYWECDDARYD